jgi:hypothetical protein
MTDHEILPSIPAVVADSDSALHLAVRLYAHTGRKVSLRCESAPGVTIEDVLNESDTLPNGALKLPNFMEGKPQTIVLKLAVANGFPGGPLIHFRLAYDISEAALRVVQHWTYELPLIPQARWSEFPVHHQVREWVTLLEVARERQQTIQHLRAHQFAAAHEVLQNILRYLDQLPQTLEVLKERRKTLDLLQDLESYRYEKVIKKSVGFITARRRGL